MSPPEDASTADQRTPDQRTPDGRASSATVSAEGEASLPDTNSTARTTDPVAQARARLLAQPRPDPPPPPPPRNGFAIAAFVMGILAFFGGGLLSIVFGIIALVQIRRRGDRGKGLAIAGLAITGAQMILLAALLIIAAVNHSPLRNDDGDLIRSGPIGVDNLRAGDCLERLDPSGTSLPGIPCDQPHLAEVFGVFDIEGEWTGEESIAAQAGEACVARLSEISRAAFEDTSVDVRYAYPSRITWLTGDREVVCFAEFVDGPRTRSLLDG